MSKPFFTMREFDSPDLPGSGARMDDDFLNLLNDIRRDANIPFIINSAYRTPTHNQTVGGSKNSAHLRGLAVDVRAVGMSAKYKIIKAATANNIYRIGIYKTFIHLDNDYSLPQGVFVK